MKSISTSGAPLAIGPYSQAVDAGAVVYLSGQIGVDPATGVLMPGFAAQVEQALRNLGAVLEACGLGFGNVPSVDVYLTDMGRFQELNYIYSGFFSGSMPARLAVEVKGLPAGAEVEVRCIAHRNATWEHGQV